MFSSLMPTIEKLITGPLDMKQNVFFFSIRPGVHKYRASGPRDHYDLNDSAGNLLHFILVQHRKYTYILHFGEIIETLH